MRVLLLRSPEHHVRRVSVAVTKPFSGSCSQQLSYTIAVLLRLHRGQFSGKPRDMCVLPLLCSVWPKHGHQIHACRCFALRDTDCIHCCIMDCFTWKKGTICSPQCMTQHGNCAAAWVLLWGQRLYFFVFVLVKYSKGGSKQSYWLIWGLNMTQNEKQQQFFSCKLPPPYLVASLFLEELCTYILGWYLRLEVSVFDDLENQSKMIYN